MSLTDERIREMFDAWFDPDDNGNYWYCFLDAYRMAEAEATKPQEPCLIYLYSSAVCSRGTKGCSVEHTTPQPCPKCAEGMVSVTKEDANNYCRILTLLGMEEEGSPVEGVERLISLRDGMTCGDCNDTGWLENREEGRYPCTCMTEAEPYQILQDKCAELEQDLQTTADALAENEESEKAWEMLYTERVRYLNDVGDVLGQNNTDESLINAAKRVMETIDFQKKAWEADFVRLTRMEAAIERMRIAGGKDEFQKAFDDAKGLL